MSATIHEQADIAARCHFYGIASAVRRWRGTQAVYVPLIRDYQGHPGMTYEPLYKASGFATYAAAKAEASRYLRGMRDQLRADLLDPSRQSLRELHGLPRTLPHLATRAFR